MSLDITQGSFGIRIESLLMCEKVENSDFLQFENVTIVPIQLSFIDVSLLTTPQREYLNKFHTQSLETLGPLLAHDERALAYLKENTKQI